MIDIEKWREIFSTLSRHKLRTALTAFGVFWGIFMLTVLLGAGKGLENGVNEGFPRVTNTVYIWQQGTTQIPYQGMPIGRQIRLKPGDVDAIARNGPEFGGYLGRQRAVRRAWLEERRFQHPGRIRRHRGLQFAAHRAGPLDQRPR
jgi:putative ABC transport system permease protein